jgi:hypothetical protein
MEIQKAIYTMKFKIAKNRNRALVFINSYKIHRNNRLSITWKKDKERRVSSEIIELKWLSLITNSKFLFKINK